jgi:hypothetical protein
LKPETDAVLKIFEKIIDKTYEAVPAYLTALSIALGVNILATSLFIVGRGMPTFFGFAFVIAPLYLLLIPYFSVMKILLCRRRFYSRYTKLLLEEDKTMELLEIAKTYVKEIQKWWWNSVSALMLYLGMSFVFLTLQMWLVP